jgi:predicted Zn-dependent protease
VAWRLGLPESHSEGLRLATEATTLAPASAAAWGWRALMERSILEFARPDQVSTLLDAGEHSTRRALALDPREGNALAARATLPPLYGDWNGTRARLADALGLAPGNPAALDQMGIVEMATGRVHSATAIVKDLVEAEPLAAIFAHKNVYRLWSTGDLAGMDAAADRAFRLWPLHPAIWMARMFTLAFTGRAAAAVAFLDEHADKWKLPPPVHELYATTYGALASRDAGAMARAIDLNMRFATEGPGTAVIVVNHLGALNAVNEAFQVLDGYLLRRGPLMVTSGYAETLPANIDVRWKKTMGLFLPVAAPLRADPRFPQLMEDIGLAAAWRESGLGPDYLEGRPI